MNFIIKQLCGRDITNCYTIKDKMQDTDTNTSVETKQR